MSVHVHIHTYDAGFEESKHPRAANGEFGKGGEAPKKDNQGRNLEAVKKHMDFLAAERKAGEARSDAAYEANLKKAPLPEWTNVRGVKVLRSGSSRYVAVPKNGKENSASFDIIDIEKGTHVTTLKRGDAPHSWLWKAALREYEEAHPNE